MKKKPIVLIMLVALTLSFNLSYAQKFVNYRTYEIVKVTDNSITMRYKDGKEYTLHWEPKGLKVGDRVRYDRRRHKLKRTPLPKNTK